MLKDILPERTHLMEKLFLEPEFAEVKMSKVCVEAQKESKYDSLHDNRCCGIPCVVDAFETIVPVKRSFRKHFMELLQKP